MNRNTVIESIKNLSIYKQRRNFVNVGDIAKAAVEHARQYSDKEEQAYQCVKYAIKRILND